MTDPLPTVTSTDPWVSRINALSDFAKMIVPYIIALGASFGWWHTSTNNSNQLQSIHAKIDDNAKELKLMTGMNRNANLKG